MLSVVYKRHQQNERSMRSMEEKKMEGALSSFLYYSETGQLLYKADYTDQAEVRYSTRDASGNWSEGRASLPPLMVPYNLPDVSKANRPVFVVGDEFDVEALRALATTATCGIPDATGGKFPME